MAEPEGTALEAELFGQDEAVQPKAPSPVREREEMDMDEQPHQAMAGVAPVPPAPAPNPAEYKDVNKEESDGEDGGDDLFGESGEENQEQDEELKQIDEAQAMDGFIVPDEDDELTAEEREMRRRLEYAEDDNDEAGNIVKQEQIAQIALSNYGLPAQGKVWHARLPNFLSIESTAFDELLWDPPEDEQDQMELSQQSDKNGGNESQSSVPGTPKNRLPDENLIRWRWVKDQHGQVTRQSNARVVRWSDGSLSLQVGSEMFDIAAAIDQSALLSSTTASAGPSKNALANTTAELSAFDANRGHGLTYLTAKHDEFDVMEAQASVHGTMTFRPATLASKIHRRLAEGVAGRYVKGRGTKVAALPELDPERVKADREKAELEKQRKARMAANKGAASRRRQKKKRAETRLLMGDEEMSADGGGFSDDDDDDEGDLGSGFPSRRRQPGRMSGRRGEADEEDDDGFVVDDEEDVGQMEDDEGDLEMAEAALEKDSYRRKDRRATAYTSDEEDDGDAPADSTAAAAAAPKRRLVVADSDED